MTRTEIASWIFGVGLLCGAFLSSLIGAIRDWYNVIRKEKRA